MCYLTVYVTSKASGQQEAISFGKSKVVHGFLTAQGVSDLNPLLFKGQLI